MEFFDKIACYLLRLAHDIGNIYYDEIHDYESQRGSDGDERAVVPCITSPAALQPQPELEH